MVRYSKYVGSIIGNLSEHNCETFFKNNVIKKNIELLDVLTNEKLPKQIACNFFREVLMQRLVYYTRVLPYNKFNKLFEKYYEEKIKPVAKYIYGESVISTKCLIYH